MSESLMKYGYPTYSRIPGTEDWLEVASVGEGCWDWTQFKVFYSPSARRYFWHGDSGCSCSSWGDNVSTADSFENGSRDDLLRAWETFARDYEHSFTTSDYLDGASRIRDFRAPVE